MSSSAAAQRVPAPVDVDAVVAAVTACPSVAHLVPGGPGDQIATFLPGRRVGGIRITDDALEVHLATRWDAIIPAAAAEVRSALEALAGGRQVTVAVDDVDDPQAALPATTPDGPPLELVQGPVPMGAGSGTASPAVPDPGEPPSPPDAVPSPS